MFASIIIVFNEAIFKKGYILGNKVLIGFQVDTLVFQIYFSSSHHHSNNTISGDMSGLRLVYVHCRGACYGFSHIFMFFLLPSSFGTPPFLRMFSLSCIMSTLVSRCVPGTIRSVRVHSAMGLTEYLLG